MSERRINQYVSIFRNLEKFKRQMNQFFVLMICLAVMSSILFEVNLGILIFGGIAVILYAFYWVGISSRIEDRPILAVRAQKIRNLACSLVCIGVTVQSVIYYKGSIKGESAALLVLGVVMAYVLFAGICFVSLGRKKKNGGKEGGKVFCEIIGIGIMVSVPMVLFQENYGQSFMEPAVVMMATGSAVALMVMAAETEGDYRKLKEVKNTVQSTKEERGGEMVHIKSMN